MKILVMLLLGITLVLAVVDINTASKQELMTLNGVGSKKADAILKHREGSCFKDIKALTSVKGIGSKFLEKNLKDLKASECKK